MVATLDRDATAGAAPAGPRRWGLAQYLAVLAVPLIAYEVAVLVAWAASGPYTITRGSVAFSLSWWWARGIEIGAAALALGLLVGALRASLRDRRMTFELKLWIALLLTSFWDTWTNFLQPIWFYSSEFVNLNEWWGHAPGYVSASAGHHPFPVIALVLLYPCFVLESRLAARGWAATRRRWPQASRARLLLAALAGSLVVGAGLSWLFVLPHLWQGPGMGPMIVATESYRWSFAEFLYVGTWSTAICFLRYAGDGSGPALTERGLDHLGARRAAVVSTLATTAWCTLALLALSSTVTLSGLFARPYPTGLPEHLPNVVCDIPGDPHSGGSAYGPCPGSPGFRIPLR